MASIKIDNLNLTGSDLLNDSESFLNDLSDSDYMIHGGIIPPSSCLCTILTRITLF